MVVEPVDGMGIFTDHTDRYRGCSWYNCFVVWLGTMDKPKFVLGYSMDGWIRNCRYLDVADIDLFRSTLGIAITSDWLVAYLD